MIRLGWWLASLLALAGIGLPSLGSAQDLTVEQFFLPGTNTSGFRVHASSTEMALTLAGPIRSTGGYKSYIQYSHAEQVVRGASNVAMPIAGTSLGSGSSTGPRILGVVRQRMATTGSIIGIAIASSAALTYGAAHVEATITNIAAGQVNRTEFLAVIGGGLTNTQFATTTRARGRHPFGTGDAVGCNVNVQVDGVRPLTAELLCTLIVEH